MEDSYLFRPRGIGANWLRCFICGSVNNGVLRGDNVHYSGACQPDMASFVKDLLEGLLVQALFVDMGLHCYLDYRPSEPNWVQLKLGACDAHAVLLTCLSGRVFDAGNRINREILASIVAEAKEQRSDL